MSVDIGQLQYFGHHFKSKTAWKLTVNKTISERFVPKMQSTELYIYYLFINVNSNTTSSMKSWPNPQPKLLVFFFFSS